MSLSDLTGEPKPNYCDPDWSKQPPRRKRSISWLGNTAKVTARSWFIMPLVAGVLAACSPSKEASIACPVPQAGKAGGDVTETAEAIAAAGARLRSGGENAITEMAGEVRARQPNVSQAEVVDYLVTAYGPEVNKQSALDASAKRGKVQAFASRAEKIVSGL